MTECSFDLQATSVIDVLGLYFDVILGCFAECYLTKIHIDLKESLDGLF